ncbi:MAG: carbon-nitrogen hydrolase [Candidatus Omnitrophota bacterium]
MNKKNIVRVALVQSPAHLEPAENIRRTLRAIERAAQRGARIICLQELFSHRYFCQQRRRKFFELAETVPGPTTRIFSDAARRAGVALIVPLFERCKGKFYNTAAVIDSKGRLAGKYRKLHIPYDPLFYEKYYFVPGNLGLPVFELEGARVAVLICYDQWFPEAARLAASKGAQILFYPTAIGWKDNRLEETAAYHESWTMMHQAHAVANGVFVGAANRVGVEGKLHFWGGSMVCGPFGQMIGRAGGSRGQTLITDCDLSLIGKTRTEWPFERDRRKDLSKNRHIERYL